MTHSEIAEIKQHLENQLTVLQGYNFDVQEPVCPDINEFASTVTDAHVKTVMQARTSNIIGEIESALKKINNLGYGVCEECGEPIGLSRLKARPTTCYCVHCQADKERHTM